MTFLAFFFPSSITLPFFLLLTLQPFFLNHTTMDDTVQNSQHTWAGKDAEPMDAMEENLFFLEKKLSTLQSENKSMRASGNDLLKEKIELKEHNLILADMITNLNSYITQLRSVPPPDNNTNTYPVASTIHREQKIPDPPLFSGDPSKARTWIMDMRLKLAADAQLFRNEQAKMIYINSRLEGSVKHQLHPFINDDLTFRFANANAMFTFLTSLYDDPDRRRSAVSALGNLHQRNKPFSEFMPEFTRLMNDVGYTDDQSKIDLLAVKLSDEMNQLLIGQDMPLDYLGYVNRIHKLDTDVRVANQRKNARIGSRSTTSTRSNFGTLNQPSASTSEVLTSHPSSPFTYYPNNAVITGNPFTPSPAPQSLPTQMELDSSSRPRGPLTDAEKQFRKQRGLCNYCGGHGYGTPCAKLAQRDAIRAARSSVKSHEMSIPSTPATIIEEPKNS